MLGEPAENQISRTTLIAAISRVRREVTSQKDSYLPSDSFLTDALLAGFHIAPKGACLPITDAQGIEWFERTFGVPLGDKPGQKDADEVRARASAQPLDALGAEASLSRQQYQDGLCTTIGAGLARFVASLTAWLRSCFRPSRAEVERARSEFRAALDKILDRHEAGGHQ